MADLYPFEDDGCELQLRNGDGRRLFGRCSVRNLGGAGGLQVLEVGCPLVPQGTSRLQPPSLAGQQKYSGGLFKAPLSRRVSHFNNVMP